MLALPIAMILAILDALTDAEVGTEGEFDGAIVHLFKNDITPDGESAIATFTEADFDGYAASSAVVWGDAFVNDLGRGEVVGDTKQFDCTGATTPNVVYGYYITNTAGDTLLFAERFADPREVNADNQAVLVVPRFTLGQV